MIFQLRYLRYFQNKCNKMGFYLFIVNIDETQNDFFALKTRNIMLFKYIFFGRL